MTAGEVIDRIKKNLGTEWRDSTYRDTFKFGGPDTIVTGIATSAFATMEVIEKAAAAGLNMIIPHEVTYWNDRDDTAIAGPDRVYQAKVDLMRKHDMAVFRIHDHMHAQRPDFTYVGTTRDIGLDARYETAPGSHRFNIPETTLAALAASVQKHSGARALRIVGNPDARVSRIQVGVGYASPGSNNPEVDVVITGEQQESDGGFDNLAYVHDAATVGVAKGLIVLGHVVSEEAGMLEMAAWIKGFVPEVPVQLIKSGEPFWVPK
jgi:putative NIF3 family GTP cyclohydrolase 1 type 2